MTIRTSKQYDAARLISTFLKELEVGTVECHDLFQELLLDNYGEDWETCTRCNIVGLINCDCCPSCNRRLAYCECCIDCGDCDGSCSCSEETDEET